MATSATPATWGVGDRVRVRRERWRIAAIDGDAACRVLRLDGLGPHNIAEDRTLLEPFETIEPLGARHTDGSRRLGDLQWQSGRRRWRRTYRDLLSSLGPWTRLRSVDAAGIAVMPHQLEPALAVLEGRGTRVLLADAVGLGKTLQAGIVLSELLRRSAVHSALVLTPAGLRDQWQRELYAHFNLEATIVDFRAMARAASDLPLGVNPWTTCSLAIASVDYVKRPEVLPAAHARGWDVVIIDEAHAVTPGSDRYAALAPLCRSALVVVLLTATPHSGDRHAFAALRALGALGPSGDDCLLFRRTRADVALATSRRVHVLRVRPSAAELRMHAALDSYADAVHLEATEDANATLLVSTLRKRALSSPESLRASVDRRLLVLDALASGTSVDPVIEEQLPLPLSDSNDEGGELDSGDAAPRLDGPGLQDVDRERALLERIRLTATEATASETKLGALTRLLRRLGTRGETAIVFTEYRDTLLHLRHTVAPDALVLHGGLGRVERRTAIDAFTAGAARVLLATDAAGEGLNLHHACRCVVHLEVPWNPVRLEQRIGRVDRIGQARPVHGFCLVSRHHTEQNLLQRLARRVASADEDVGMASPLESTRSPIAPATGIEPDDPPRGGDAGWRHSLAAAAEAEAQRIRHARALRGHLGRRTRPSAVAPATAIVARARPALRRWLSGRGLLLIEFAGLDDVGRQFASVARAQLIVVRSPAARATVATDRHSSRLSDIARSVVAHVDRVISHLITDARRDPCVAAPNPFWSMLIDRASAIARATSGGAPHLFQPGLFDRRAERIRRLRTDEHTALADLMAQRARQIEALSHVASVSIGKVLLLLP